MYKGFSNEELIKLYRENQDENIKDYFFGVNKNLAFSICNKYIKRHDKLREDVESEALVGLVKAFNTFNLDKGYKFTTYAGMVIRNEVLKFLHQVNKINKLNTCSLFAKLNSDDESLMMIDLISTGEIGIEELVILDEASVNFLSRATERERDIFILTYFEDDLSQRKIAERLGVSQRTVCKTLGRINKLLSA
ncbi:sigma-70 family RNA polymerase sigma factor [Cytobacillus gottheilii]|uniref:sigma-70 family RNA polymerase sigma factor n=1 Tax=Cytobacillus gottheilii TaxID=859144 RepID=UPI0009BB8665|nr:sigma-70 family RNA polymerase sigma factor [Cytobacillus gottheilii]